MLREPSTQSKLSSGQQGFGGSALRPLFLLATVRPAEWKPTGTMSSSQQQHHHDGPAVPTPEASAGAAALAAHVQHCLRQAQLGRSTLPPAVLDLEGMTGTMTRMFYNSLLGPQHPLVAAAAAAGAGIPPPRLLCYLEVGCWLGSSFISALHGNAGHVRSAVVCDNWSEFCGPKEQFLDNVADLVPGLEFDLRDDDCFALTTPLPADTFHVYLYDGPHDRDSHRRAITCMWHALASLCIVVVDDWNWEDVREGTWEGLRAVGATVAWVREIRMTQDGSHTPPALARRMWWNGMAVFVLEKGSGPGPPGQQGGGEAQGLSPLDSGGGGGGAGCE